MNNNELKVFMIGDYEWFMGYDAESCRKYADEEYGYDEGSNECRELSIDDLERLKFDSGDGVHSAAQELEIQRAAGGEFPRFFASSEY